LYVDIHCHLLPGVDDGAKDWKESSACLERARQERISAILVTPHIWPGRFPNTPGKLRAVFEEWKGRAADRGIDLHLGSEVFFRPRLAEALEADEILAMGGKGAYLLVELPLAFCPPGVEETLYDLRLAGVEPIVAHPERYAFVIRNHNRLAPLGDAGIPFQVTSHSIAGAFGAAVQKTALSLLEKGWCGFVASDAHSLRARAPMMREAVRLVARRYGKEAARRLCIENPRRVIEGRPLLRVECAPTRAGKRGLR